MRTRIRFDLGGRRKQQIKCQREERAGAKIWSEKERRKALSRSLLRRYRGETFTDEGE